ncbi:hypothetical protein BJ741DRAFT_604716 [Chytriomyces cf. hyalinus JEL632]|nr:hypothetical protein BJ741DRAFT_604716 [Chytriomyces cf. hyalinus JEL632]
MPFLIHGPDDPTTVNQVEIFLLAAMSGLVVESCANALLLLHSRQRNALSKQKKTELFLSADQWLASATFRRMYCFSPVTSLCYIPRMLSPITMCWFGTSATFSFCIGSDGPCMISTKATASLTTTIVSASIFSIQSRLIIVQAISRQIALQHL